MWPWEHVLFAYVFYSLFVRLRYRSLPGEIPVAVLAFGSFLPDLVDKPLAWQFGLFETGWAVAHSVFVVIPVTLSVYWISTRHDHTLTGIAFAFGYLLHLLGDVLPASIVNGRVSLYPILWPFRNTPVTQQDGSFLEIVHQFLSTYLTNLLALELTTIVALQMGSVVVGIGLWLADGTPGLRLLNDSIRRLRFWIRVELS